MGMKWFSKILLQNNSLDPSKILLIDKVHIGYLMAVILFLVQVFLSLVVIYFLLLSQ